jgi:serine protease Do
MVHRIHAARGNASFAGAFYLAKGIGRCVAEDAAEIEQRGHNMNTRHPGRTLLPLALLSLALPSAAFAASTSPDVPLSQYTVSDVAERVSPAVVSISTEVQHARSQRGIPNLGRGIPDFRFFFGPGMQEPTPRGREVGAASGVIISQDGFIVTNNHVVKDATEVRVKLNDGRELKAKVVGADASSDLALVKIDASGLPFLRMGDSAALRLGEIVLAIGNPFNVGQTVTMGIVSAKGRSNMGIVDYEDFIQTDAAINPGNSGGALVNLHGDLVGINTAILSRTGAGNGVGFAVPSNMVKPIIDQIRKSGHVSRGWIGVAIQDLTPELAKGLDIKREKGVVISDVLESGPAARAGVQSGDVVTQLNGQSVTSMTQLRNEIAMLAPGSEAHLMIDRRGSTKEVTVRLDQKKDNGEAQISSGEEQGPLSGVGLQDLSPELRRQLELPAKVTSGIVVTEVDPSSSAARSGLREGDVIVTVNKKQVGSTTELRSMGIDKGRALLRVWRGGSFLFIVLNG